MSSDVSSTASVPEFPPDSPGSSVSTRLQEEYEELLKYAVVVPTFDNTKATSKLVLDSQQTFPQTNFVSTQQENSTTVTTTTHTESQQIKDIVTTPRFHPSELPDFQASPIPSKSSSCDGSSTDTLEKPEDKSRPTGTYGTKEFMYKGSGQSNYQPMDVEYERDEDNIVYTGTVDADVAKMENLMDQWCLDLKRNVLAEFGQSKIRIVEYGRQELMKEKERHACEQNKLVNEIDSLKELLHTYEQSMERKDEVISNLTHAMQKQKERKDMMKQFCEWRIKHNDVKREAYTSNLAKRHYERNLSEKVWAAWHSIIENKWRSRVERACQSKAQEVCMQLTNDYEAKIATLNEELDNRGHEISILHSERDKYEETMKKAFMRGVCALNLEAMNMFHGSEEEHSGAASGKSHSHDVYSDNLDGNGPQKEYGTSKSIPRDSTESLPPRIITSQGSRPHSTTHTHTQSRSVISKQTTSASSSSKNRPSSAKISSKTSTSQTSRSTVIGSTTLAPPMASVMVERHPPVNKQTIGQATASKFPKVNQTDTQRVYKRLAGQSGTITITPHLQSVKVVE
ncbi:hypothetical protein SNE40_013291 [Patella caerulea]|uniref:Centrosomal protein POC5 n=1 Tax=Patella caerulea TaxID=87958 RepID=A0AAN8PNT3_PATCE